MLILLAPILVVLLFFASIACAIFRKWKVALLLVLCGMIVNCYSESVAIHPFANKKVIECKAASTLRVMAYNVWCIGPYMTNLDSTSSMLLVRDVRRQNVDLFLMCEMSSGSGYTLQDSIEAFMPYTYFLHTDTVHDKTLKVFSKYPLKGRMMISYGDNKEGDDSHLWTMKVVTPQGDINLATLHLPSNGIGSDPNEKDNSLVSTLRRVQKGYADRAVAADALRTELDKLTGPTIVMGDFNDIGGSYTVRTIKGDNLVDAWWEGGNGFGFTYDHYHLLLRLDHILYSKQHFQLKGVKVLSDWKYSDHYPLVADLELK